MNYSTLMGVVEEAKAEFRSILESMMTSEGAMPIEIYKSYLNLQYHLTNGVQRHFFIAASHPDLSAKRPLREFLFRFGNEEEPHYEIALRDLTNLGFQATQEPPFDVQLWWAYFNSVIYDRPFLRLGATCILENIGSGANDLINSMFKHSKYLTPRNSVFFRIHRHDDSLPHGEEILNALKNANLSSAQYADLVDGAKRGWILYSRMLFAINVPSSF